jgi:hypothetical protein
MGLEGSPYILYGTDELPLFIGSEVDYDGDVDSDGSVGYQCGQGMIDVA